MEIQKNRGSCMRRRVGSAILVLLLTVITVFGSIQPKQAFASTAAVDASKSYNVTLSVTYGQTEARNMLSMINALRTPGQAWAYNSSNAREYYSNLASLTYDYDLERIAMLRAAELALKFDHTRPNGSEWSTAYTGGNEAKGENIAYGYTTAAQAFAGWEESNAYYAGQGHRRNMLSSSFTCVGIGHVIYQGTHYWVQEFRSTNYLPGATAANNSQTDTAVTVIGSNLSSIMTDPMSITVRPNGVYPLSSVGIILYTREGKQVRVKESFTCYTDNGTIASIQNQQLVGRTVGSTNMVLVSPNFGNLSIPVLVSDTGTVTDPNTGNTGTNIGTNTNVTAPAGEYVITLDPSGGVSSTTALVTTNGRLTTLPVPTRTGYTFDGWYTAYSNDRVTTSTTFYMNTTLTARWIATGTGTEYTVIFNANGGTLANAYTKTTNQRVTSLPTPTRAGYSFVGWYTDPTAGTVVSTATLFTKDTVVYARWTAQSEYTISFNANGGQVSPTSLTTTGQKLSTLPTPTRTGYTFTGWYTMTTGGTAVSTATTFTQNSTVYAQWKEAQTQQTTTPTTPTTTTTTAAEDSRSVLLKKVNAQAGGSVTKMYYMDFDNDGNRELFAVTDENGANAIWFASTTEVDCVNDDGMEMLFEDTLGVCKVSNSQRIFVAEMSAGGSGSQSKTYYVKNGKVYEADQTLEGLDQISGAKFAIYPSAYDAQTDGTGRTNKKYYVKWNGTGFTEYKASKISQSKFKKYSGGTTILNKIKKAGYSVKSIYKRSNGYIHLNVRKGSRNENVTVRLSNNKVSVVTINSKGTNVVTKSTYGGVYKAVSGTV